MGNFILIVISRTPIWVWVVSVTPVVLGVLLNWGAAKLLARTLHIFASKNGYSFVGPQPCCGFGIHRLEIES